MDAQVFLFDKAAVIGEKIGEILGNNQDLFLCCYAQTSFETHPGLNTNQRRDNVISVCLITV